MRFLNFGRVVDTTVLREEFGYTPRYTTEAALADYARTVPPVVSPRAGRVGDRPASGRSLERVGDTAAAVGGPAPSRAAGARTAGGARCLRPASSRCGPTTTSPTSRRRAAAGLGGAARRRAGVPAPPADAASTRPTSSASTPTSTDHVLLPILRPLFQKWFRVETQGLENVPDRPAARCVVANHSGTLPVDALMTTVALHDDHPAQRRLRLLGADLVFDLPFIGSMSRKMGSTLACNEDAERLLTEGELVGVFPEGFKGIGKPFRERYTLQRFGRGGFVTAALRTGVPIIPCAIVGAEEIYPMIGNAKTAARLLGLPYFPITPTFPLLGPLGLVPLPSKWLIAFGEPIETASYGPGRRRGPDAGLQPHRPGARDHPALALPAAPAAQERLR